MVKSFAHAGIAIVIGLALPVPAERAVALEISDRRSPRTSERPLRRSTDFIILHTTEGPKAGSLNKLRRNGEAHYLVDRSGHV